MTRLMCVDVGNSRLKWAGPGDKVPTAIAHTDTTTCTILAEQLKPIRWAVAGVNPAVIQQFILWAKSRQEIVHHIANHTQIPIAVDVDYPDLVGLDRILGVLAAKQKTPTGEVAITVDVGTAVTVNMLNKQGVFAGGAIFPGPRLMAIALHTHTAKLPALDIREVEVPPAPGRNTEAAIRLGISHAIKGGVRSLIERFGVQKPHVYLTGGGLGSIAVEDFSDIATSVVHIPTLVLDGIRIATEAAE